MKRYMRAVVQSGVLNKVRAAAESGLCSAAAQQQQAGVSLVSAACGQPCAGVGSTLTQLLGSAPGAQSVNQQQQDHITEMHCSAVPAVVDRLSDMAGLAGFGHWLDEQLQPDLPADAAAGEAGLS